MATSIDSSHKVFQRSGIINIYQDYEILEKMKPSHTVYCSTLLELLICRFKEEKVQDWPGDITCPGPSNASILAPALPCPTTPLCNEQPLFEAITSLQTPSLLHTQLTFFQSNPCNRPPPLPNIAVQPHTPTPSPMGGWLLQTQILIGQ